MFMSDPGIAFTKSIGWTKGPERTGRYAMIIDHGKIVYAENEAGGDVTVCLYLCKEGGLASKLTLHC